MVSHLRRDLLAAVLGAMMADCVPALTGVPDHPATRLLVARGPDRRDEGRDRQPRMERSREPG